jgi:O-antigen/teichoic acid export membrane protein
VKPGEVAADASRDQPPEPLTGSRRRGLLGRLSQVGRKLSWGVADQAVSSLSNFAVNIYIARLLGAEQYGTFAVVFVTYAFALNASRGLVSDPLMIRFSHVEQRTWRRVTADSSGAAVAIGLALGGCLLVAAGLLRGTLGLGLLALALTLPGLLLQDSWRFAFFSAGRGFQAFLNDAIWLVLLLVAMAALQWWHVANVFWAVLAWGGAATVAALIGPLQAKVMPRLGRTRNWLTRQRDLGLRYMAEGMTNSLSNQLRTYGVGLVLGLASVGYINAANTLMAAFVVLVSGSALILLPQATRLWRDNPQSLVRFCAVICVAEAVGAAVWGAILLISLPLGLGHWLLGGIWRPSYSLVLPTLLVTIGFCVTVGPGIGLKGMGASRQSLRSAVLTAPLYVGFSLTGAWLDGAYGAVMGTAVAMWCSAAIYWWQLRVAMAASSAQVTGSGALP